MAVPEEICPECHSVDIKVDWGRGERVCQDCGLVLEDNILDDRASILTEQEARPSSPYKDGKGIPLQMSGRKLKWKAKV